MNITTYFITEKEMQQLSKNKDINFMEETGLSPRYRYFQYYSPKSIGLDNSAQKRVECKYVIAKDNEEIIGVLQLFPIKDTDNVFAISYITVHELYRNQGVSKKLYICLNEHVEPHWVIYGTDLSPMGKLCKLNDIRKKYVNRCTVYTDKLEYRYYHLKEKLSKEEVKYVIERNEKREAF